MEKVILFVDDEEAILKVLSGLFRCHGYTPRCASSGTEALELFKKERFRLCFLDLRMPEMDGIELCKRIKQLDAGACVYALSAFIEHFNADEFKQAGFAGCFHKPFKIDLLLNTARDVFARIENETPRKATS